MWGFWGVAKGSPHTRDPSQPIHGGPWPRPMGQAPTASPSPSFRARSLSGGDRGPALRQKGPTHLLDLEKSYHLYIERAHPKADVDFHLCRCLCLEKPWAKAPAKMRIPICLEWSISNVGADLISQGPRLGTPVGGEGAREYHRYVWKIKFFADTHTRTHPPD